MTSWRGGLSEVSCSGCNFTKAKPQTGGDVTVLAEMCFYYIKRLNCDPENVGAARPDTNIWSAETLMEPEDGDVLYINKDASATNSNDVRNRVRLLLMSELQPLHLKKPFTSQTILKLN